MTEVAIQEEVPLTAEDPTGGRLVAWAASLTAAHRIGTALCETSFCPQHFRGKPDEAAAAILFGDEIGLTPTQALRSVHVISGTPGLYARTMVALVQSHGHRVWTEKETETEVIVCGQRAGDSHTERSVWTLNRAQKAGYTRNTKYAQTPQDMLYARAAATVCRRIAPDALAGLAVTVEELELEDGSTTTETPAKAKRARRAPLTVAPEPDLPDNEEPETPEERAAEAATDQGDDTDGEGKCLGCGGPADHDAIACPS